MSSTSMQQESPPSAGFFVFAKPAPDQCGNRIKRVGLVGAVGSDHDPAPLACRQHHHAHQALGVDLAAAMHQRHFASEIRR